MKPRNLLLQGILITVLLMLVPMDVRAQTLKIVPQRVESSGPVEKAMQENKGRASTKLEGRGGTLRLTYQASQPITIYMVPLNAQGGFVPTDFLLFTMPPTDSETVEIDLTVSPGWSPRKTTWLLHLLTKDERSIAGFVSIEFVPTSAGKIISTMMRHFFTAEPYTPSSYHALYGYRAFTFSVTIILGILLMVMCALVAVFTSKGRRLQTLLLLVLLMHALYGLRFSVDLVRFTHEHLSAYARGEYDEAGSIYRVAPVVRELAAKNPSATTLFVCRSGTNYKEKILRYFVYPTVVTSETNAAALADFALAMDTDKWSLETVTESNTVDQFLLCGDLRLKVQTLESFPDGSILFALLR